jgi:hypothetical protein
MAPDDHPSRRARLDADARPIGSTVYVQRNPGARTSYAIASFPPDVSRRSARGFSCCSDCPSATPRNGVRPTVFYRCERASWSDLEDAPRYDGPGRAVTTPEDHETRAGIRKKGPGGKPPGPTSTPRSNQAALQVFLPLGPRHLLEQQSASDEHD